MVAADTVADCGWRYELANYGEYSGASSMKETYTYAKIMFSLMTRHRHPDGKFLIVGGDQSCGRFCVGVQGVQYQNLNLTS